MPMVILSPLVTHPFSGPLFLKFQICEPGMVYVGLYDARDSLALTIVDAHHQEDKYTLIPELTSMPIGRYTVKYYYNDELISSNELILMN